jgi:16S rRNA processing protein RimM
VERPSDPVVVGVVVAAHGTRGTLRVRATGAGRHLREGVEPMLAGRRMRISQVRRTPKGFLVDVEGIEDRSAADAFSGEDLVLDRRELDVPEEGEFYVDDLIGLSAVSDAGEVVGTVRETLETPAHEILVVGEEGDVPALYVPFTIEHVPEVDLGARRVVVRPPE